LKKTHQAPPTEENDAMRRGHYLEDAVVQWWMHETGEQVIKASAADIIYVHPEYDYMRVTPDRIVKGRKKILEVKSTAIQMNETIPDYYLAQVTYQMYVTGIHQAELIYIQGGLTFGRFIVDYDEEFAEFIAAKVTEFWNENVLGGKEPDAICVEDLAVKVPKSTPEKSVTADESALDQIAVLREKKAMYEALGDEITDLQNSLKMFMEDSEALVDTDGNILLTWKSGKDKTSFDSKRFAEENPDMYEKYCKTVPGARSFLLKKPKA
jgi:predicted phage-related endonuclease